MGATGDVLITIADGGAGSILVPASSVQVVIGCSSAGTAGQILATRSPATLQSTFGYGPLVEAAALSCIYGGTVLAVKAASQTAGSSSAVIFTGTGTSVITVTGTPLDTYYVKFLVVVGGTIGTAGITFQVSLDAGRNYGPVIALGTANTYAIPNTGITLNFGVGNLVAGDAATFGTTEPAWNTAGVQTALNAIQASQYALAGWGSMHLVGVMNGANCSTIEGYLDALATGYVFTRAFASARDASPAAKWGGTGETESTWMTTIQTDFASTSAKRFCVGAAHYNMPSAFPNSAAGAPRYRRPIAWAAAARQVTIPPQRHNGRVKDGSLSAIVVDPTNDPQDGFIYHDERINPGLDYLVSGTGGRFMSARTRIGKQGIFITNPLLMSPSGSDFYLMPLGSVIDVACSIVHQVGQDQINDDVRLTSGGSIFETDARAIENAILYQLKAQMVAAKMCSAASVTVDRTWNVSANKSVNVTVTITARGYVLTENVTVQLNNPNVA